MSDLFLVFDSVIFLTRSLKVSQFLIVTNNSNRAKDQFMEPAEENKSVEKGSSQGSERKRRRPSLFPIRSSARRKSSMSEAPKIFNPHDIQFNSNRIPNQINQKLDLNARETKSDESFEYRTPSVLSEYSSPRTSRSSPKEFIVDTPFVPFVHQSLSKTIWQSDDVIPEQKDEIERKQSQTQPLRPLEPIQQIKEQKNQDQRTEINFNDRAPPNSQKSSEKSKSSSLKNQPCVTISISVSASDDNEELKMQTKENQIVEVHNEIQHNQYVSKAPIYYEETKDQTQNNQVSDNCQGQPEEKENKRRNLSFSYLDCISIRPVYKIVASVDQQTSSRILSTGLLPSIEIFPLQKHSQCTQIERIKLQIANRSSDHVKSVKKHTCSFQTSFAERLALLSQSYDEMIGIPKQHAHYGQQTKVPTRNCGQQTVDQKLSIHEQVNFSISHNYGKHFDEKINRLQNYIKTMYETKEAELEQLRNRRSIDRSINTQSPPENMASTSSNKKSVSKKSVRNFSCQYDPKDFGSSRPSLKRVSIADTKIIYEIDDDNSTETFEQSKSKNRRSKSKKDDVKIEQKRPEEQCDYEAHEEQAVEEPRKSKRKSSKTPKKKKSKR